MTMQGSILFYDLQYRPVPFFMSNVTFYQNVALEKGINVTTSPSHVLAAGVLYKAGILLGPAMGAMLMSLSTVIVAINARFLKLRI